MRRALIVGINDYEWAPLQGCINDANEVGNLLERHFDGTPNFDCKKLISSDREVTRTYLGKQIHQLFANQADIALLYFSGHGAATDFGNYLVTQDALKFDEGIAMNDIMVLANQSKAGEVIIILDCCYSGNMGNNPYSEFNMTTLREGVTVITSSTDYQTSKERQGMGVFTRTICEALDGEAADLLGEVNISGVYGYADKIFDSWQQRPVFKSHIASMTPIRKNKPKIDLKILRRLPEYFEIEEKELPLSPSFEHSHDLADEEKVSIFQNLQKCVAAGLVVPVGEEHMYYAAINSKSCKLTNLGQYYWKLAKGGRL
ncbi:MAG: caspase family protein [Bacteroidota bacterium]